jgi:hypothetical protein
LRWTPPISRCRTSSRDRPASSAWRPRGRAAPWWAVGHFVEGLCCPPAGGASALLDRRYPLEYLSPPALLALTTVSIWPFLAIRAPPFRPGDVMTNILRIAFLFALVGCSGSGSFNPGPQGDSGAARDVLMDAIADLNEDSALSPNTDASTGDLEDAATDGVDSSTLAAVIAQLPHCNEGEIIMVYTLPNGEQMRHCRPIGPVRVDFQQCRLWAITAQNSDSGFPQFLFGAYDNPLASLGETQVGFRISAPGPNGCGFDTHHCSFVGTCAIQVVQNGGINNNVEFYLSRACTLREPDLHQTVTLTEAYLRGRLAIGREITRGDGGVYHGPDCGIP